MKRRSILALLLIAAAGLDMTGGTARAYEDGGYYRVCRIDPYSSLSLRTCPSTSCRRIFRMRLGTLVKNIYPYWRHGWRKIEILPGQRGAGLVGWAYGYYLCEASAPSRPAPPPPPPPPPPLEPLPPYPSPPLPPW